LSENFMDIKEYSDAVNLIYEASLQPALWEDVLRQITIITPSVSATLYAHERIAKTPIFHHSYGDDPTFTAQYVSRWAASNPIVEAMAALSPGDVAPLGSILDYAQFARTAFFQEWGRPQGFCDVINVMLERTPSRVASLSLIRADCHGMADEGAISRVKMLAPHVLRSVRIGRVLEHATVERQRLRQTLDGLGEAVLLLDPGGGIVHANDAARSLLHRGLSLDTIARPSSARLGGAAKGKNTTQSAADDVALVRTRDGVRRVCHLLPLGHPLDDQNSSNYKNLRLAVIRERAESESATKTLKSLFKLTPRERDVLFGLVEVGSLPATAAALGIAVNTARSHLKSLFLKTGTHRQAQLVALVSEVASPFHASNHGLR
jgi:DNA-binding CsgD family transcriptional regulator